MERAAANLNRRRFTLIVTAEKFWSEAVGLNLASAFGIKQREVFVRLTARGYDSSSASVY